MEKMNDLKDLFKHEIHDLYSVEEQIISALPTMIEKAKNPQLKKALQTHLKITEKQLSRLEQVQNMMGNKNKEDKEEKGGLFSRLFKSRQVCRGMEGILEEGNKIMNEDMNPDVLDAAIIAAAQKVEHYEICGYGTARTYARELGLAEEAKLLEQTLNEEYEADDLLTQLAITHINSKAEGASANKKATTDTASKSAGPRGGNSESVRKQEPEREMASAQSRSADTDKQKNTQNRGGAPKGTGARDNAGTSRGAAAKKSVATSSKNSTTASPRSNGHSASSGERGTTGGKSRKR